MPEVTGRSLLAFFLALIVPLTAGLESASAQSIATVSGWHGPSTASPPDSLPPIWTNSVPSGLPGISAKVEADCEGDSIAFWPSLTGATFDVRQETLLHGQLGAFGSVNVGSNTYKYIDYQIQIDSGAWSSEDDNVTMTPDSDRQSGKTFRSPMAIVYILGKSTLTFWSKTKGQSVFIKIDLKDPFILNYIQSCDAFARKDAQQKEAEEKQRKTQETERALANIEQQRKDQTTKKIEALVAYLGLGPLPDDSVGRSGSIFFRVGHDVHGYMLDNAIIDHTPLSQLMAKPSGLIDPLIEMTYVDSVFKDKDIVPTGTECVLINNGSAKILLGKKYIELHCRGFPEGEFIPVDAITYLHKPRFD